MPTVEWFTEFFQGVASDLWTQYASEEMTEAEAEFFLKELHLQAGHAVLDVPSGNGRHAIALARRGIHVTGVDITEAMLRHARSVAKANSGDSAAGDDQMSGSARFEKHDMRALPFKSEFDAAFCAGNSFGYFTPEDTLRFLNGVAASLKPDGYFLIDTSMAAESFFVTGGVKEWVEVGDIFMLIENSYVPVHSRLESRLIFLRDGKAEERTACHHVHTVGEISRMLASVGLTTAATYATTDGDPFQLGSERLFLIAQKQAVG